MESFFILFFKCCIFQWKDVYSHFQVSGRVTKIGKPRITRVNRESVKNKDFLLANLPWSEWEIGVASRTPRGLAGEEWEPRHEDHVGVRNTHLFTGETDRPPVYEVAVQPEPGAPKYPVACCNEVVNSLSVAPPYDQARNRVEPLKTVWRNYACCLVVIMTTHGIVDMTSTVVPTQTGSCSEMTKWYPTVPALSFIKWQNTNNFYRWIPENQRIIFYEVTLAHAPQCAMLFSSLAMNMLLLKLWYISERICFIELFVVRLHPMIN